MAIRWRSGDDHGDGGRVDVGGHVVFYVVGDGHALGGAAHFGVFHFHRLRHEFRVVVAQYRIACGRKKKNKNKYRVSGFSRISGRLFWWGGGGW